MKLSIVMPAFNEAAGIEAALLPLQSWRQDGVEVIVADGGSNDATRERAVPLADRVIEAPRGRARQMNAGAALARGDVLLFLHADTLLPQTAPEAVLRAMSVGTTRPARVWGRFDVSIAGDHPMLGVIAGLMNWRSRLTGIATGDQAMFMTRAAFDAVGGFPDQPLMEDVAISRQLKTLSPPVCFKFSLTTSGRRWEKHGIWRTIFLMWRLRFAYWCGADPAELARRYYRQGT